jgi:predicted nuclease of restriction endonuclease-like (RecB) superfamily
MSNNSAVKINEAAEIIKNAIVHSRYNAAKMINKELLGLYYGVGKYVSDNSRSGTWGKGAIKRLSEDLQNELPGLRGFSESSIKRMRDFYEQWVNVFANRPLTMGDLETAENTVIAIENNIIDLGLLANHLNSFSSQGFLPEIFLRVGFTHHSEITAKEKTLNGRFFYIAKCAENFWTVETLKSNLRGELYQRLGAMPNNFLQTIPEQKQATRAIYAFKDEYFLDYINIEPEIDPDDRDERVFQRNIIANIKQFILSFGSDFCFMGNQYRVLFEEKEFFIDLLFFHRELRCLVAIELKRGEFKPMYLGQLNFYLSALDEFVRHPYENPSIGIILCKEANRNIVEFAVRDYSKPMGVATYRTRNEMPENLQKALPDFEDMRKLMDAPENLDESEGEE